MNFLSATEVADELDVSRMTVHRWAQDGKLPEASEAGRGKFKFWTAEDIEAFKTVRDSEQMLTVIARDGDAHEMCVKLARGFLAILQNPCFSLETRAHVSKRVDAYDWFRLRAPDAAALEILEEGLRLMRDELKIPESLLEEDSID